MARVPQQAKRRRGVILSPEGWKRLQSAQKISERDNNNGHPFTIETLAELTGLSINTVGKVRSRQKPVDPKTLAIYFEAFGLTLEASDHQSPTSAPPPSKLELPDSAGPLQNLSSQTSAVKPAALTPSPKQDWGEAIDVSIFHGRTHELDTLTQWITKDRCRLICLQGMGGIGKTALSVKISEQLQAQFSCVIWRSLRNAPILELLLADVVGFLTQQQQTTASIKQLLQCLKQSRCLLILDNMETLMEAGQQAGQFLVGYKDYDQLLRVIGETGHQSCVILTSREKPAQIAMIEGMELAVRALNLSGSLETALALVDTKGLTGTSEQRRTLCEYYGCSPLALKIVTSSIQDLFEGNIAQFLAEETMVFNGVRRLLSQQLERLSDLENSIMYWLAINREWTSIATLATDMIPTATRAQLLESLESLSWRSLIEQQSGRYTQQPVVMEYVTERLIVQIAQELLEQSLDLVCRFALLKTTLPDFLSTSQKRLILIPILHQLKSTLGSDQEISNLLQQTLNTLRLNDSTRISYGGGNVLNLGKVLGLNFTGYDCSQLAIWQASLQDVLLHQVNFSGADFANSTFMQTFSGVLTTGFSADGTLLATGDSNCHVRLWRVEDGQLIKTLMGHQDWVRTVAFNPDGTLLASGSDEYTIILWDLKTGAPLRTLTEHKGRVCTVQFSPDGHTLISSSDDLTLRLWDVYTGDCLQIFEGHAQQVWSVAFSPMGEAVISGGEDNVLKLWDIKTGQCLQNFTGHRNWIWSVAFSPKGQIIASGSHDNSVKLWDADTGDCLQTLQGHTNWIWSIAFAPQGTLLASGSEDQTVRLWDVATGRCLKVLEGHTHRIWSVSFSPRPLHSILSATESEREKAMLISGSGDQTLRFWDISWSNRCQKSTHGQTSQTLVSHCLRTVQGSTKQIWSVAYSPDAKTIASGGDEQTIRLWDIETEQCDRILKGHLRRVTALAFSPDGHWLASCSEDQTVRLWEVTAGVERFCLRGHTKQLWTTTFSADGKTIASAGEDQTIRLWDVNSGKCVQVLEGHSNWIWQIAFSPTEAILASASFDQTLKLWDIETGDCMKTLSGHEGAVMGVGFSSDGQQLVSGGMYDQTLRLWSQKTGKCLQVLPQPLSMTLACSSSNKSEELFVVSGGADGTLTVWRPNQEESQRISHAHDSIIFGVALSSDGQFLISGSTDETVQLRSTQTLELLQVFRPDRPYEGMNLSDVTGLTDAQKSVLIGLGACVDAL